MEQTSQNPGLQHILEQIFINLEHGKLLQCQKVNASWNSLLKNPSVWLKICLKNGFLSTHGKEWLKVIQTCNDQILKDKVLSYLMEINSISCAKVKNFNIFGVQNPKLKIKKDIHPFHRFLSANYFLRQPFIKTYLKKIDSSILNEPFNDKHNMIHYAVCEHDVELLKIFIPFLENPNAPDQDGWTPIQQAAMNGSAEIIKLLIPYTDNPNSPDPAGYTPIQSAAFHGHVEVINILAPLSDNPNAPDPRGFTPIQTAAKNGNFEIIKILAPLVADNLRILVE